MAQTIKHRRSATAGAVPASLASGEIAINETDNKLFTNMTGGGVLTTDLTAIAAAVRYDVAQTLTTVQQAQARANIGAGTGNATAGRELLTANRTYYVALNGSDSNSGLTAATPFATAQKAVDVACSLDLSIYGITIQLVDGVFANGSGNIITKTYVGAGPITIKGNSTTPANTVISGGVCFTHQGPAVLYVLDSLKLTGTTGISCSFGSYTQYKNIDFGACTSYHVSPTFGGRTQAIGNNTISGGANAHIRCLAAVGMSNNYTLTLTNTPAFAVAFVWADRALAFIDLLGMTYSGAATGPKYTGTGNGVIFTNGAGTSALPGSTAGTLSNGALYL
jgi:hypothetical protein